VAAHCTLIVATCGFFGPFRATELFEISDRFQAA